MSSKVGGPSEERQGQGWENLGTTWASWPSPYNRLGIDPEKNDGVAVSDINFGPGSLSGIITIK